MIHESFKYTDEIHQRFQHDGYFFFDQFLTQTALEELRNQLQQMLERARQGVEQILSPHQLGDRWVLDLARQPKILDMIGRFVGPDIVLWSAMFFNKPPGKGAAVPWHQDRPYWNVTGRFSPAIWIPLDDVDDENGGMCVIPGWHAKDTLPIRKFAEDDPEAFTQEVDPAALPANVDQIKVQYDLKAGQAAIHDVMLPHSSKPNRSKHWRRVVILRYLSADGQLGPAQYTNYMTGERFEREGVLVRGRDVAHRGWKRVQDLPESIADQARSVG